MSPPLDVHSIVQEIRRELGLGHKEEVYHKAFEIALREMGVPFDSERHVSVYFHEQCCGYVKPDLIVNNETILEFKTVKKLNDDAEIQLRRYVRLLGLRDAYLVNFWGVPDAEVRRVTLTDEPPAFDSSCKETE
jgi:GxxExxY protein